MIENFEEGFAEVNGTRLHYFIGGEGEPLVLMDGWPRTIYGLHKIIPSLAEQFRVIAVDYRGQGASDKPEGGYDKKNMAKDVYELVRSLGFERVHIAAGDVGAMVAYSFAANYPEATDKLAVWEGGPYRPAVYEHLSVFPKDTEPNVWWYPLAMIEGLPEKLLAGRFRHIIDATTDSLALYPERVSEESRAIYAASYDAPEAVAAAFRVYRAVHQDMADYDTYAPLTMPTLVIGARYLDFIRIMMDGRVENPVYAKIEDSGHYIAEEQPEALVAELKKFFS
ncbi:alpha/beta hydrolase [Streptomyces sp. NBC_01341]|uniref:alpha/beta fold hydrolase n=1 Tax=Streptomyces sp. NBC_01341 TaxID=2903831 RepID=UPI002E13DB82|nr:alpha/beta hydrolase [Streptomyces sp. NBC_01341]